MNSNPQKSRQLYNPTTEDITTDVDKFGTHPEIYTLKAGDVAEFPEHVASLIETKLIDKIYWQHPVKRGKDTKLEEIKKLIRV